MGMYQTTWALWFKKKKNPGGIVATFPAIKWALEILGHSEGGRGNQPTQPEEEKEA